MMIDLDKIHCLGKGQPTEDARGLLGDLNTPIAYPRPHIHAEDWAEFLGEKLHPQQACRLVQGVLLMVIAGDWEIFLVFVIFSTIYLTHRNTVFSRL